MRTFSRLCGIVALMFTRCDLAAAQIHDYKHCVKISAKDHGVTFTNNCDLYLGIYWTDGNGQHTSYVGPDRHTDVQQVIGSIGISEIINDK
jgi:hypothetical protein